MDTDQYILSMCQAILRKQPNAMARFKYKDRGDDVVFNDKKLGRLNEELDAFCDLRFNRMELDWIWDLRYTEPFYLEHLRMFQPNRDHIQTYLCPDGRLCVDIYGPLSSVIWFEVPTLRMISCIHREEHGEFPFIEGKKRLEDKIAYVKSRIHRDLLRQLRITDFGTRRAWSPTWHEQVIGRMIKEDFFTGTSNMLYAMLYDLPCHGTMAHLWLQLFQQVGIQLKYFQQEALKTWAEVYQGDLGIALSDIVGMDAFFDDFNLFLSKLFDGARHDSGDPYEWGNRLIRHYQDLKIDPLTKFAVFSDGLSFEMIVDLFLYFHSKIKTGFGIGTSLTNDLGFPIPKIVIKMVECNDGPVAKVSDSSGKGMCEDAEFEKTIRRTFGIEGVEENG